MRKGTVWRYSRDNDVKANTQKPTTIACATQSLGNLPNMMCQELIRWSYTFQTFSFPHCLLPWKDTWNSMRNIQTPESEQIFGRSVYRERHSCAKNSFKIGMWAPFLPNNTKSQIQYYMGILILYINGLCFFTFLTLLLIFLLLREKNHSSVVWIYVGGTPKIRIIFWRAGPL